LQWVIGQNGQVFGSDLKGLATLCLETSKLKVAGSNPAGVATTIKKSFIFGLFLHR
jgi:hypothetical protein